jgi:hypothetical protein
MIKSNYCLLINDILELFNNASLVNEFLYNEYPPLYNLQIGFDEYGDSHIIIVFTKDYHITQ